MSTRHLALSIALSSIVMISGPVRAQQYTIASDDSAWLESAEAGIQRDRAQEQAQFDSNQLRAQQSDMQRQIDDMRSEQEYQEEKARVDRLNDSIGATPR